MMAHRQYGLCPTKLIIHFWQQSKSHMMYHSFTIIHFPLNLSIIYANKLWTIQALFSSSLILKKLVINETFHEYLTRFRGRWKRTVNKSRYPLLQFLKSSQYFVYCGMTTQFTRRQKSIILFNILAIKFEFR